MAPSGGREGQELGYQQQREGRDIGRDARRSVEQSALQCDQDQENRKGIKLLGIVAGAAGSVVARERLEGGRDEVDKAGDTSKRHDNRGECDTRYDQFKPLPEDDDGRIERASKSFDRALPWQRNSSGKRSIGSFPHYLTLITGRIGRSEPSIAQPGLSYDVVNKTSPVVCCNPN